MNKKRLLQTGVIQIPLLAAVALIVTLVALPLVTRGSKRKTVMVQRAEGEEAVFNFEDIRNITTGESGSYIRYNINDELEFVIELGNPFTTYNGPYLKSVNYIFSYCPAMVEIKRVEFPLTSRYGDTSPIPGATGQAANLGNRERITANFAIRPEVGGNYVYYINLAKVTIKIIGGGSCSLNMIADSEVKSSTDQRATVVSGMLNFNVTTTPGPSPTTQLSPTVTPSLTLTPVPAATNTPTAIPPTPTSTLTITPSPTGGITLTPTVTAGATATPTVTPSPTASLTPTTTPTGPVLTPTITVTPTITPSPTGNLTPSSTPTPIPCSCPAGMPPKSLGNANCDRKVDGIDFEFWREEFRGLRSTTFADFNCNGGGTGIGGRPDQEDFEIWKRGRWITALMERFAGEESITYNQVTINLFEQRTFDDTCLGCPQ